MSAVKVGQLSRPRGCSLSFFKVFERDEVATVALLRRRDAERTTNLVLALLLLSMAVFCFLLSQPALESLLAPQAKAVGLEVQGAQRVVMAVAAVCATLFVLCVGVLMRDARAASVVRDPSHLLGATLRTDKSAPSTPVHVTTPLTPTAATKPMMPTPPKAAMASASRAVFSPSTPPVRSPLAVSLTDERQLHSFLQRASSSPSSSVMSSTASMSLSRPSSAYQTAYRLSGAAEDAGFKESEAAKLVLQRLRIELAMHSEWPYRMRRWMSELVERCVALADELKNRQSAVDRAFRIEYAEEEKKRKLQQQQQQQQGGGWGGFGAGLGGGGGAWGVSAFSGGADSAWGGFGGAQATEEQMRQEAMRRAEESVLRKHELLQRYLDVTQDRSCKEYVLERLRQLADGGTLSSYEWNGGGKFKGREWSHDSLPTDAQVLLHLFVTKLNTLLYQQAKESGMDVGPTPFSNRYLLITPQTPDAKNKDVLLWLQRRSPPHLKVVVRGETWDVAPGQNNLIHGLVLYIYAVAKEERGVIEMMSLAQTAPELLKIVAERK